MKISVVGLGYVGLPLAVALSKKHEVIGLDINETRIKELKKNIDRTDEVSAEELQKISMQYTSDITQTTSCNIHIVTVPTPIDEFLKPDLTPVVKATESLAKIIKKGDIIVYESTVYPGVTEDICVPILETSGLKFNIDFYCGYSPERINPGDKVHRVETIKKIVSGSNDESAKILEELYASVITAGIHLAPSLKVAEMAKVIENTQRDINIAFMNELAIICSKLGIDTKDVLNAAETKWNFLRFYPGLVGGHCIGVDPYYLAHKSAQMGYIPEMILAGRKLNEFMPQFITSEIIKLMTSRQINISTCRALVLGITFKEDCPDIRNSKVYELVKELQSYHISQLDVYDPLADAKEVEEEYGISLTQTLQENHYDIIVLAVSHKEILTLDISKYQSANSIIYDIKSVLPTSDKRL